MIIDGVAALINCQVTVTSRTWFILACAGVIGEAGGGGGARISGRIGRGEQSPHFFSHFFSLPLPLPLPLSLPECTCYSDYLYHDILRQINVWLNCEGKLAFYLAMVTSNFCDANHFCFRSGELSVKSEKGGASIFGKSASSNRTN